MAQREGSDLMNAKEARKLMEKSNEKRNDQEALINKFLYWFFMKDILRKIKKKAKKGEFVLEYEMDGWSMGKVYIIINRLRDEGYGVSVGEMTITNRYNVLDTRDYPYIVIGW